MSASFNYRDDVGWLRSSLRQGKITPAEMAIVESHFDEQTDHDDVAIFKLMTKEKFLRKVCLYKLITFPVEVVVIAAVLGFEKAKTHTRMIKLYFQFMRKKVPLQVFQEKLKEFIKERPPV